MGEENKKLSGLSSSEVKEKIKIFGFNEIKENGNVFWKKISKAIFSPISLMLLAASAFSYWGGKIFDAYFILFLLFLNFFVSFWQERKADRAIEELNKYLLVKAKVNRDGQWKKIDSRLLVPGDLVELNSGNVVPADLKMIEEKNFSLNEAALTGESLPVEKKVGDLCYSGSFVATGKAQGVVTATGKNAYFGKLVMSLEKSTKRSVLQKDILTISRFLSLVAIFAVAILTIVFSFHHQPLFETLSLDLSLIIAGIPVALPTVMTMIISLNVLNLAKKNVVVRRLGSLEDLANVDLLFSDKTGTLTANKLEISHVVPYDEAKDTDVVFCAYLSAVNNKDDLLNQAMIAKAEGLKVTERTFKIKDYILPDSIRKRGTVMAELDGRSVCISVGAPQIIKSLCKISEQEEDRLKRDIAEAAKNGYRVLAVAINNEKPEENNMMMEGLLLLADNLRRDAKRTIDFMRRNGIEVKMLTGDHREIAERIGGELGLNNKEIYSQVLPEDKLQMVKRVKKDHIVAVTGDGINDLAAVKTADVGFAVSNAVDALKSAADIVLLNSGIAVIGTAIIEARKIFARIYSYSVYRISESFRIIITVLILGIFFREYPLTPIQLILLTLLNDVPIISLAYNRVGPAPKPARIDVKKRFIISTLYGMVGILNSLIFFIIFLEIFHSPWHIIVTAFFLKLTVSGHLLIFVAHTEKRWYKFLPSYQVIAAIIITQLIATSLAVGGFFMPALPWQIAVFVWIWSIVWMQIGDLTKILQKKFFQ